MFKTGRSKSQVISALITVLVIAALVVAGPAMAITLTFANPSHTATSVGTPVSFDVLVTADAYERIPIENVILNVEGTDCYFPVKGGSTLSDDEICQGFTLTRTIDGHYDRERNRYGYGFGYAPYPWEHYWTSRESHFGYGYGYGYGPDQDFLAYHVAWGTAEYTPGVYDFRFLLDSRGNAEDDCPHCLPIPPPPGDPGFVPLGGPKKIFFGSSWFQFATRDILQIELFTNICGNGILEGAENCDDGNLVDGDGCSAACSQENGGQSSGSSGGRRYTPPETGTEDSGDGEEGDEGNGGGDTEQFIKQTGGGDTEQFVDGGDGEEPEEVPEEVPEDNLITGQVAGDQVAGGAGNPLLWLWILLGLVIIIGGVWYWKKK